MTVYILCGGIAVVTMCLVWTNFLLEDIILAIKSRKPATTKYDLIKYYEDKLDKCETVGSCEYYLDRIDDICL